MHVNRQLCVPPSSPHRVKAACSTSHPRVSQSAPEFEAWRQQARRLLASGRVPDAVHWDGATQPSLLQHDSDAGECGDEARADEQVRIPARLLALFEACACHRDLWRYTLMYRVLWRATHGERDVLDDAADDDVRMLTLMAKSVDRDCHKMHAFVRFREVRAASDEGVHFVASYTPEHHIVRRAAPFFVKRFGTMVWTIVTPDGGSALGSPAPELPARRSRADVAGGGREGSVVAHLLREHLQSGTAQRARDAAAHATEVLVESARSRAHSQTHRECESACGGDDRDDIAPRGPVPRSVALRRARVAARQGRDRRLPALRTVRTRNPGSRRGRPCHREGDDRRRATGR